MEAWGGVLKATNTTQGLNQQRFANTLDKVFKMADANADKAFQYAGVAGKAKQGFDAFNAQLGTNDPNYDAYNKFVTEDVPAMVTEIIRTGGASSTDAQKAIAISQALPITIKVNTPLARSQYKELQRIYRGIGKTISEGLGQTQIDLSNTDKQPSNDMVQVQKPSGGMITLPRSGAEQLVKDHPDHKIIG
jgi:hypothetical protein